MFYLVLKNKKTTFHFILFLFPCWSLLIFMLAKEYHYLILKNNILTKELLNCIHYSIESSLNNLSSVEQIAFKIISFLAFCATLSNFQC